MLTLRNFIRAQDDSFTGEDLCEDIRGLLSNTIVNSYWNPLKAIEFFSDLAFYNNVQGVGTKFCVVDFFKFTMCYLFYMDYIVQSGHCNFHKLFDDTDSFEAFSNELIRLTKAVLDEEDEFYELVNIMVPAVFSKFDLVLHGFPKDIADRWSTVSLDDLKVVDQKAMELNEGIQGWINQQYPD